MDIAIVLVLIVLNGVFAMSEIALVSSRRVRLERRAERGDRGAAAALALSNEPTTFLSTVQIGITLIGIFAGAFGEAAIARDLQAWLEDVPALAPYAGAIATAAVVLAITYLSLVVGELVPKRLGMANPEGVAAVMSRPMRLLSRIARPLVWILSVSTHAIARLFGLRGEEPQAVTEEDVRGMIEQATTTGDVLAAEQQIIDRVFRLGDLRVRSLMIPRTEVVFLDAAAPIEQNREKIGESGHSCYPVCDGDLDNIRGVVMLRELIRNRAMSRPVDLTAIAQPPLYVPETAPAFKLLELFRTNRTHAAVVVDEFGDKVGFVTLDDLFEAMTGPVAGRPEEPMAVRREDGSWLLDGAFPVHRLHEILSVPGAADGIPGEGETIGGLVTASLGHIPTVGEVFEWGSMRFEVVDMDRQRVDKVLLTVARSGLARHRPGSGV